ncbi:MAG: glycerophosphodiester phosphodiesterase [Gammaproteobacteria bacterium]|nr:MAG: glycerophosphodiester phosphodiesterase [Gammaproteobacteria bacterium]
MTESGCRLIFGLCKPVLVLGLLGLSAAAFGFDLQGHRGARGLMPENTLPAFARALEIGVTTLELDLAVTRDREVVVMHDPRFEPAITRNRQGLWLLQSSPSIQSMTLAQVKTYDVGRLNPASKYAEHYPAQQAIDGTRVPTLGEVFDLVEKAANRHVRFNIEIKINPETPALTWPPEEFARAVIDVVRKYRMQRRVIVQSFDWRALREVQELEPSVKTSYLTVNQDWLSNLQTGKPGPSPWLAGLDVDDFGGSAARAVKAAGGAIWSPYHKEVSASVIKLAQDMGLKVNVWTVNEPTRMRELIGMGVDGIITDYPDRLRKVLKQLDLPLPMSTPVRY